jgi:uncharacterized membrane protein
MYVIVAILIATQFGTWTDEEYTLATTAHGPLYAYGHALTYELQAPLYFVLEALWRELDPSSVLWARLPSIACNAGLFFTTALIARRLGPERNAIWFALLATLNPFVVFAGFEIRLYAFALLLASIMWLLFDSGFAGGRDPRARVAFVIVTVAAIYVQYFLAFALAGFFCALVVRGDRRVLGSFVACCAPIVLAALPLALFAHDQVGGYETSEPPLGTLLRHAVLHPWLDFLFPFDSTWGVRHGVHRAYLVLVALAFATVLAARPRFTRAELSWVACAATVECVYLALIIALRLPLNDRHYVALYVPLAAAAYAVACAVLRGKHPAYGLAFGLCAVLSAGALTTQYRALALPGDWRRVGSYLTSVVPPDDAIVLYTADNLAALRRQYHGRAPIVAFPVTPPEDAYDVDVFVVHSEAQAAAALEALARYPRLWFVSNVPCYSFDESYGCVYVQSAIARSFTIVARRDFYGSSVEELQRSAAAGAAKRRRRRMATNAGTSERRGTRIVASETFPIREKSPTLMTKAKM